MAHLEFAASTLHTNWTPPEKHAIAAFTSQQITAALDAESARNQLIAEYLPIVRRLARQLCGRLPRHINLEDLVSAGTLGLLEAASKVKSAMHLQFRVYAQARIQGAMLYSLRKLDWSSRSLRRKERELQHAVHVLTSRVFPHLQIAMSPTR